MDNDILFVALIYAWVTCVLLALLVLGVVWADRNGGLDG